MISIHASREGSDTNAFQFCKVLQFQSTLPAREATNTDVAVATTTYISIHASREGSDNKSDLTYTGTTISIHASREGSDKVLDASGKSIKRISIHASREGSDVFPAVSLIIKLTFQSTLPAREATIKETIL